MNSIVVDGHTMSYEPVTIRETAQLEVLLLVGLAFVGGLAVTYWGFQTYQFGRIIRDTPPEPVGSVAMGRTEVRGSILPADRVYDQPFTDGQCIYAEFTVMEYQESDDDDSSWETIQSDSVSVPFYIDDGTGRILVEPDDETIYELSSEHRTKIRVDGHETPPEQIQEFLSGASGSNTLSVDEITDAVGGVLDSITGGDDGEGAAGGQDESAGTVEPGSRDDRESESREPTYETADGTAVEYVRREELGSVSGTGQDRRYIQTVLPVTQETYVYGGATREGSTEEGGTDDRVAIRADPGTGEFIVSDRSEFELASTYRNRSIAYIVSGIVASALILGLLAQILITGPVYGVDLALP